jgi:hypothetical protein
MNGIQTWMASPARVESAGVNFSDKLLNLCSLCFLLFKFISVFRLNRQDAKGRGIFFGSDKPCSIGLDDGNSGIRTTMVFGPPSDPTMGGSVHEPNPSAWVLLEYRRRDAKPARLCLLRIHPKHPHLFKSKIKNQKSKIITRKSIFPISLAKRGGLGIVDEMREFFGD